MSEAEPDDIIQTLPLDGWHRVHGARMVPFAGYQMPIQYDGIIAEHLWTRESAGLFDVSHMGQLAVRPRSGRMEDAALALERAVPIDILELQPGRQRYALLTNDEGRILDDLMIANLGDHFFVVVNAACKEADEAHLRSLTSQDCASAGRICRFSSGSTRVSKTFSNTSNEK